MKNFLVIIALILSAQVFSQQEYQFSHYHFARLGLNPGYAGMQQEQCFTAMMRQQWIGFKDAEGNKVAPVTYLVSANLFMPRLLHGGLGITISKDHLGFEDNINVKLAYSYHQNLPIGKIGIGIQTDFINKYIDFNKFVFIDQNDPLLQSKKQESNITTDFGAGLYYRHPKYYIGISSTQLAEKEVVFRSDLAKPVLKRHYYLMSRYDIQLNPDYLLRPSFLIKSDLSSTQYDLNCMLEYKRMIVTGLSYRTTDAMMLFFGLKKGSGYLGLSYDITTSAIGKGNRSSGTIELVYRYCFNIIPDPREEGHGNVRGLPSYYNK
ncbi:MAG: type IX secretion system membrane protein PorP/SprF [Bacteroidetes bacterium]|nr:type IX secretion system membrane protein PorP/SprF [Bacteroidota bacterium]